MDISFECQAPKHQERSVLATRHVIDPEEISAANKSLGTRAHRPGVREIPNDWFTCQGKLTVSASFLKPSQESGDSNPASNARKSEQCQTGSRPPATSKALKRKRMQFSRSRLRVSSLASTPRLLPLNCYRYVRSFCIIGARVSGHSCQVGIRFSELRRAQLPNRRKLLVINYAHGTERLQIDSASWANFKL